MFTLGIDLSSQPKDTAACLIEWSANGSAVVQAANLRCNDAALDALIAKADVVGIDAPLGWPEKFVEAVSRWSATTWEDPAFQKALRLRLTDRFVHETTGLIPLSVSTDRIGLPAMRAMALLARQGVVDRSGGDGRFFEVYPAGSLKRWGLASRGYKGADEIELRRTLLASLRKEIPALRVDEAYADSDHAFDALVASLTARAAATGKTVPPPPENAAIARREGWIHLPASWPV